MPAMPLCSQWIGKYIYIYDASQRPNDRLYLSIGVCEPVSATWTRAKHSEQNENNKNKRKKNVNAPRTTKFRFWIIYLIKVSLPPLYGLWLWFWCWLWLYGDSRGRRCTAKSVSVASRPLFVTSGEVCSTSVEFIHSLTVPMKNWSKWGTKLTTHKG